MASVFGETRQHDLSRCRSAWPWQAMGPRSRPPSPGFVHSLAVLVALPYRAVQGGCRGLQGSPGVLPLSSSWGVPGAGLDWTHQGSGDGGGCRSPSPAYARLVTNAIDLLERGNGIPQGSECLATCLLLGKIGLISLLINRQTRVR